MSGPGHELTRRDAVRRGLITGGVVLATTSAPLMLEVRNAFAKSEGDASILERAVVLEQTAVVVYDRAVGSSLLRPSLEQTARLLRDQEQEHADALTAALEKLGGRAPEPPKPGQVKGLAELTGQAEFLRFAVELENMLVKAYIDAHRRLEDEALLGTSAQIMANEGQHLVVLRQALGADPVPVAFEAGTST